MARRRRSIVRRRGFTLAEVLVAGTILFGVTAILALIFSSSYAAFRRGTSRLSTTQRAREVVRRLMPIVMSAVAPNSTLEAVYYPPSNRGGGTDHIGTEIRLHSADDILTPMAAVNPRNPIVHQFRVRLIAPGPDEDGDVVIDKITEPLDPRVPYGGTPDGSVSGVGTKVIASRVRKLDFEHLDLSIVKVKVTTSEEIINAAGQPEDLDVERTRVISIPYYSAAR